MEEAPMKFAHRWVVLALLPALLTACGSGDGTDQPAGASATPAATSSFPVTIGTGDGAVEIPARPERIVSLSPSATEMLFAIGAGDLVVAVDEQSDYPPGVPTTDLPYWEPNVEAIGEYEPDLVVAAVDPGGLVTGLEQLGVPALLHPSATSLDDTYTQIEQLGVATGHVSEAATLVAQMQAEIDEIVAGAPERPEPLTYYHELDTTYYSLTSATFLGEVYGLLGMRSIADDSEEAAADFPQLASEFIVDADPDVILLATAQCCGVDVEELASRPGWDQLAAVRENRVIELDEDIASRWGPRVVDFLRTIADQLAALVPVG
jgi:iron complex transport system substrate-binding protein